MFQKKGKCCEDKVCSIVNIIPQHLIRLNSHNNTIITTENRSDQLKLKIDKQNEEVTSNEFNQQHPRGDGDVPLKTYPTRGSGRGVGRERGRGIEHGRGVGRERGRGIQYRRGVGRERGGGIGRGRGILRESDARSSNQNQENQVSV